MTRAVLFDLGNTLLDEQTNRPLPGATGLLDALGEVRDADGLPVLSGLVSDWKMPRSRLRWGRFARSTSRCWPRPAWTPSSGHRTRG